MKEPEQENRHTPLSYHGAWRIVCLNVLVPGVLGKEMRSHPVNILFFALATRTMFQLDRSEMGQQSRVLPVRTPRSPTMADQPDPRFAQILDRTITPELYQEILRLWLQHVTNEERLFVPHSQAVLEDAMKQMLIPFTDDCVMQLVFTGERWTGHDGARQFYDVFLSSIDGMKWVPQALVIGPQGVLDVVNMTGVLQRPFAGLTSVGAQLSLQWLIYFPWVMEKHQFRGEIIYSIRPLTAHESVSIPFAL
jgi:hypothetical protein